MKKIGIYWAIMAIVCSVSLSSCIKNCYDCSDCFDGLLTGDEAEVCYDDIEEDDYSKKEFRNDIKEIEDELECNCK